MTALTLEQDCLGSLVISSCVIFGKLNLSLPQTSSSKNGNDNKVYATVLLEGLNELVYVKYLVQCMLYRCLTLIIDSGGSDGWQWPSSRYRLTRY